jgi:hydrophobic/amphiphilic exporter-1 (mainly G- bacteria), HAE1 family
MNWNFSAWSIRNPVPPILLFVVLMLVGIMSFRALPITQFPNIDVPIIAVSVAQSGATPVELETQITKRVEDAVAGITGVKHINSTVTDGSSVTAIEFRLEVPTAKALQDVKDAVTKVRSDLPSGVDEPVVQSIDVEGQAIQTYAVRAPGQTLEQLSWYIDDTVKRQLQGLPGVGRVERQGGVDREIRVDLDPAKLQAQGVTAATVNAQLAATNADFGAGKGEIGQHEQAIRTLGSTTTIENLRKLKISLSGGRQVSLADLGTVTDSTAELKTFARYNGEQVVTFSVYRSKGASSTEVGDRVSAKIADMQKASNGVASFSLVDDTVYFIKGNYIAAMETLIEGAILSVLVVLLFLRDWRATLISAVALPLSAIPTFWVMGMLGFSLNLVSFLGLTLATGILVDDAIVEIENIARHIRMGKSPYRAAMEAADEIGLAVIAITFSIVAVFVPVSFMGGIVGQYFKQFGMTVAVAVMFSLVVARLITPMMAAYLMRSVPPEEHEPGPLLRGYIKLLHFLNFAPTIRKRWHPSLMSYVTVVGAFGILFLSTLLFPYLPTGFIPPGDNSRFVVQIELPPGTSLDDTRKVTDVVAAEIKSNPEVAQVFVLGGSSPTGSIESRNASIFVNLNHRDVGLLVGLVNPTVRTINRYTGLHIPSLHEDGRTVPQFEVEAAVLPKLAKYPDMRWALINDRGQREIQYNLLSNDGEALNASVAKLEAALRRNPKLRAPAAEGGLDRPEIKIIPRAAEAAKLGVTAQAISQAVRVATIGDFGPLLAKFKVDDRLIPIRVQIPEQARTDFSEITNLRVVTSTGASVPLSSVADITFSRGPSSIKRFDRQRQASIGADLPHGVELGEAAKIISDTADTLNLPKSVRVAESGDSEIQGEVFSEFGKAAGLGVVLMLVVLVLLLGNVFQPFAILLSLPLSIGGVVLALLISGNAFSMPVVIGMLMLIGIVAKNAIMLIDFAVERKRHGMTRLDAIVDAGRKRARPIVMTTIAMGAGMLPSAFGIGEGGSFRAPMAIAVIGGLIAATFLSLVFVPSFFIVMDDLARLTSWVFSRFVGATDEPKVVDPEIEALHGDVGKVGTAVDEMGNEIYTLTAKMRDMERKLETLRQPPPRKPNLKLAAE